MEQETKSFNPRARVGRDMLRQGHHSHCYCFNPRARVGRDTLKTKVRIVPRGKISYIENEISFYNPATEED